MKIKNPFKKSSIAATAINVGVGGAANVAVDYAMSQFAPSVDPMYVRLGKVIAGAVAGSMVSNQWLRAAADGIATVGASELISSYVVSADDPDKPAGPAGLRPGTIGRLRAGNRAYRRAIHGTSGVGASFMGK